MQLYSNNLSTIATISSLIISEVLPACFSCKNIFNLSQSPSGLDGKNVVFEIPEALIAGDSSNIYKSSISSSFINLSFCLKIQFFRKVLH